MERNSEESKPNTIEISSILYKQIINAVPKHDHIGILRSTDGGWGWVIVIAACLIHFIVDGLINSFGILFSELVIYFNSNRGITAMIGSIMAGICSGIGPVSGGLTNKYGCRTVTLIGTALTTAGLILSLLVPNVIYMFLTLSIFTGLGLGFLYLPSIVIVNCYFEKKRALATSIASCGTGIGTLVMGPFMELLRNYYGSWKSAVLIIAGITLNGWVSAATYFHPEIKEECPLCNELSHITEDESILDENIDNKVVKKTILTPIAEQITRSDGDLGRKTFSYVKSLKKSLSESDIKAFENADDDDNATLFDAAPEFSYVTKDLAFPINSQLWEQKYLNLRKEKFASNRLHSATSFANQSTGIVKPSVLCPSQVYSPQKSNQSGLLYRKDIFYSGSLLNVPEYRKHPEIYETTVMSLPVLSDELKKKQRVGKWYQLSPETYNAINQMIGLALLKDTRFLLLIIARILSCFGLMVPYLYTTDRAKHLKISNASLLLSIIGISNILGRLSVGFIIGLPCVNSLKFYIFNVIICGVSTGSNYFCTTFVTMSIYTSVFGLTAGGFAASTPLVLIDILGLSNFTNSFGLLLCFQGFAFAFGPPLTGFLYELTGSYDFGFLISGIIITVSGLILCFIPFVLKCTK